MGQFKCLLWNLFDLFLLSQCPRVHCVACLLEATGFKATMPKIVLDVCSFVTFFLVLGAAAIGASLNNNVRNVGLSRNARLRRC